jgi:hypothetical protein
MRNGIVSSSRSSNTVTDENAARKAIISVGSMSDSQIQIPKFSVVMCSKLQVEKLSKNREVNGSGNGSSPPA